MKANSRSLLLVRRFHRAVATRAVRGFRTIATTAVAVIAGFSQFELQALITLRTTLFSTLLATD